jgi:hypothetical protein
VRIAVTRKICAEIHHEATTVHSDEEINAAIHICLDGLEPGKPPLAHVAEYIERLRDDPSWSRNEVAKVDLGIHRLLQKLI